jgi:hypothetical protein
MRSIEVVSVGQSRKRVGRDGTARWTAYYDDVTGRRRSAGTFATEKQADRACQRAEAGVAEGRATDLGRGRQRFARYVTEVWFPNHRIELTTRQNYSYYLDKHILPAFGGFKMIEIMPADIRDWITKASSEGVKPATIKYCLSVLSAIFTTALNDQITTLPLQRGQGTDGSVQDPPDHHPRPVRPHPPGTASRVPTPGRDGHRDRAALGRTDRTTPP